MNNLEELHKKHFNEKFAFPDVSKNMEYIAVNRDHKGDIVTAGMIKNFHEVIFITDMMKSKKARMEGIIDVSIELKRYLDSINAEQVHCFVNVQDKLFAKLLVDRFGFQLVRDIPLVRNL